MNNLDREIVKECLKIIEDPTNEKKMWIVDVENRLRELLRKRNK